jgi:hypothetical protein
MGLSIANPAFRSQSWVSSLFCEDANTAVTALRSTYSTGLQGHERVVVV